MKNVLIIELDNKEMRTYKVQRMNEISIVVYSLYITEQLSIRSLKWHTQNGAEIYPPIDEFEAIARAEQKRLLELKYEDGGEVL